MHQETIGTSLPLWCGMAVKQRALWVGFRSLSLLIPFALAEGCCVFLLCFGGRRGGILLDLGVRFGAGFCFQILLISLKESIVSVFVSWGGMR